MKLHEIKCHFLMFHTGLQRTDFVVLVLDKILIHEDEHEMYQIRSPAYGLTPHMKLQCCKANRRISNDE